MNFAPDVGLGPSVLASALVGFVAYIALTRAIVQRQTELIGCAYTLPFAFGISFGLFLLVFPIANLLLQWQSLGLTWLQSELQNGGLALRATSIVLVARASLDAYRYTRSAKEAYEATFRPTDRDNTEFESFARWHVRSKYWLRALSRSFFYFVVLAVLWWLRIINVDNYFVAGLSYAVFFILDDAAIITAYGIALRGRVIKSHRVRLLAFDILLLFATPLAVGLYVKFDEPYVQWILGFCIFVALVCSLFLRTFSDGRDEMWDAPPLPPERGTTRRPTTHEL